MNLSDILREPQRYRLRPGVRPSAETAEEWYGNFGAHISTERCGDVMLQTVEYDDLDEEDDDVLVSRLTKQDGLLRRDEAVELVALARRVREDAQRVRACLDEVEEAYDRGDYDAVLAALEAARAIEDEVGGDYPATLALARQIIEEPS